jgi:Glycosyl hydrolase catalytic core
MIANKMAIVGSCCDPDVGQLPINDDASSNTAVVKETIVVDYENSSSNDSDYQNIRSFVIKQNVKHTCSALLLFAIASILAVSYLPIQNQYSKRSIVSYSIPNKGNRALLDYDDNVRNDDDSYRYNDDTYREDTTFDEDDEHNLMYKQAVITPDFYDLLYEANVNVDQATVRQQITKCHQRYNPVVLRGKKGVGIGINPLGKRGTHEDSTPLVNKLNISWSYNWRAYPASNIAPNSDFLPMIYGVSNSTDSMLSTLRTYVTDKIFDGTYHTLLGYNEPDARTRTITVDTAIERWRVLHQFNIPLVSPSCVNPLGQWMKNFMQRAEEECRRVDYIGVHWYGSPKFQAFVRVMSLIYDTYKIPIVITEFSPADWSAKTLESNRHTPQEVLDFAKSALPWLEQTEWIVGYSWFSFIPTNPIGWSSSLFDKEGNLSILGQYYQSVSPSNPFGDITIQF